MALSVQTNNAAITTLKFLDRNNMAMGKSMERLSSGFRINSAADDSAGYAIAAKMTGQNGKLQAASQNALQATAMVKMADAAVQEIQNMVTRIQSLATQAASANNGSSERASLNAERVKLEAAIDKIATGTVYNSTKLLDGTAGGANATSVFATPTTNIASAKINSASSTNINGKYIFATSSTGAITSVTVNTNAGGTGTANLLSSSIAFSANTTKTLVLTDGTSMDVTFGTAATATTSTSLTIAGQAEFIAGPTGTVATANIDTATGGGNKVTAATRDGINGSSVTASVVSSTGATKSYLLRFSAVAAAATDNTINIYNTNSILGTSILGSVHINGSTGLAAQNVTLSDGTVLNISFSGAIGTAKKADGTTAAATGVAGTGTLDLVAIKTADKSAGGGANTFQIGATNSSADQVDVALNTSYKAADLGLGTGDLLTQSAAQAYITTSTSALATLASNRADLGAAQNQISFIQSNLASSIEQNSSAISTIKDADMASEMAAFTKSKILVQAGTAMLAQANQASQNVLSLFR